MNSTALTSITPTGALGKLTQLTYGVIAPGNITTNIATAGDHRRGGQQRVQPADGHQAGLHAGREAAPAGHRPRAGDLGRALVAVPIFYLVFLKDGPQKLITDAVSDARPPTVWKAVAELLTQGHRQPGGLGPAGRRWSAAVLGLALEASRFATKGRFWLSGVGIGLAAVIPFNTCLAMFLGSLFFWLAERRWSDSEATWHKILVKNQEPICAGLIAGGALMGISAMLETVYGLKSWLCVMAIAATVAYFCSCNPWADR